MITFTFIFTSSSVASGNHELFELLTSRGATCQPAADGRTVLMQAASRGDLNFITRILDSAQKYNVLVNEKDNDGWNALFYTIQGELNFLFYTLYWCPMFQKIIFYNI